MSTVDKIIALFEALDPDGVRALPPIQRRRFADLCAHWARIAERTPGERAGVLSALRSGERGE